MILCITFERMRRVQPAGAAAAVLGAEDDAERGGSGGADASLGWGSMEKQKTSGVMERSR